MQCRIVGLIVTLACALCSMPLVATAQQAGKVARVGLLSTVNPRSFFIAFEQRLRELGYVEGQNLALEFRTAEGHDERLPALAAELVRLQVDVLVTPGPEATLRAARHATSAIPIVMIAVNYDPIARGYIAGLSRPGGNITGVVSQQLELTGKRLELLKEAVPQLRRVAVLWDVHTADQWRATEAAAPSLGLHLQSVELRHAPYDFEDAIGVAVREQAQALVVLSSPLFRVQIAALALTHRLPAVFIFRNYVEAGGLMAYGVRFADMQRRAAEYVDHLLKGRTPADLPVEQPKQFELVLNHKTAQALGITFPPTLLVLADEVIQ